VPNGYPEAPDLAKSGVFLKRREGLLKSILSLHRVTKMYNREKGIRDISLSLHAGEIHGLIGVNGAGKTSVIKLMLNLMPWDDGELRWEGEIVRYGDYHYKKQIGYVPDDEVLLEHLTPMEIAEFAGRAYGLSKEKIKRNALRLFELLQLPEMNANVNGFSRGMRKKVQLACALLAHPKLLVLDEPVAGLDPHMIYLIKQLLLELKSQGGSILVSTHDLFFAEQLCDRVTLLHEGRVLLTGYVRDLLEQHACATLEELFVQKTLHPSAKEMIHDVVVDL
jgi:ABC-2 type transport system ATP-binding protein